MKKLINAQKKESENSGMGKACGRIVLGGGSVNYTNVLLNVLLIKM